MVRSVSYRLPEQLKAELHRRADEEGLTETTLVVQLLQEGLAARRHPGIVFRPGPAGRRAGLAGGPDVWEVIVGVRHASGDALDERVTHAAEQMDLPRALVEVAVSYAAGNEDEIESQIQANDDAAERVRRMTEARQRLLA